MKRRSIFDELNSITNTASNSETQKEKERERREREKKKIQTDKQTDRVNMGINTLQVEEYRNCIYWSLKEKSLPLAKTCSNFFSYSRQKIEQDILFQ